MPENTKLGSINKVAKNLTAICSNNLTDEECDTLLALANSLTEKATNKKEENKKKAATKSKKK